MKSLRRISGKNLRCLNITLAKLIYKEQICLRLLYRGKEKIKWRLSDIELTVEDDNLFKYIKLFPSVQQITLVVKR